MLSRMRKEVEMIEIKLWEIRMDKKMTLRDVALSTGLGKSTLNYIENEKISPTLAELEKIAMGIGCRITELFDSEYK